MNPLIIDAVGLLLAFSGFVALSLTMKRHYVDIYGRGEASEPVQRRLTAAGWIVLVFALSLLIGVEGFGYGLILWFGSLTASAWILVLMLNYAARGIVPMALSCALLALVLLAITLVVPGIFDGAAAR